METIYAVLDTSGLVVNTIVADAAFIKSLPGAIADDTIDTGGLTPDLKYVDITGNDPQPGPGWTRASNGRFTPPPAPDPAPEPAPDPDQVFVTEAAQRLADGGTLTQDERDRLLAIDLATR